MKNPRSFLNYLVVAVLTICIASAVSAQTSQPTLTPIIEDEQEKSWWARQPKENKMLYTNITAAALIGIWGLSEWEYGSASWNNAEEGWFENDSKYGGADKLGHFWATYVFADALTGLYSNWGYSPNRANAYAALSSWAVQTFMEVADATSETQGFSYEDLLSNTAGALASIVLHHYPEIDRKIDFRIEYVFENDVNGIFDDYSNHYYSIALKFDGFDSLENTFMKYIELHAGYFTRGFEDDDEDDVRSVYVGISVNLASLLQRNGWQRTGKVLEYLQLPYSVLKASNDLD